MSLDNIPTPLANLTFPTINSQVRYNTIDSFVTSWVTPFGSKGPCFLSLYFFNFSSPEWKPRAYPEAPSRCGSLDGLLIDNRLTAIITVARFQSIRSSQ